MGSSVDYRFWLKDLSAAWHYPRAHFLLILACEHAWDPSKALWDPTGDDSCSNSLITIRARATAIRLLRAWTTGSWTKKTGCRCPVNALLRMTKCCPGCCS